MKQKKRHTIRQMYINIRLRLVIVEDLFLGEWNGWSECWRYDADTLRFKSRQSSIKGTIHEMHEEMLHRHKKGWVFVLFESEPFSIETAVRTVMDSRAKAHREGVVAPEELGV